MDHHRHCCGSGGLVDYRRAIGVAGRVSREGPRPDFAVARADATHHGMPEAVVSSGAASCAGLVVYVGAVGGARG